MNYIKFNDPYEPDTDLVLRGCKDIFGRKHKRARVIRIHHNTATVECLTSHHKWVVLLKENPRIKIKHKQTRPASYSRGIVWDASKVRARFNKKSDEQLEDYVYGRQTRYTNQHA